MNLRDRFEQAPGSVLTPAELQPFAKPHRLAQLVGKGVLNYDGRGTYQLPNGDESHAIARQLKGVLSHRSAAAHWNLALTARPAITEVTVAPNRSNVPKRSDAQIYYRKISEDQHDDGVTTILRTVLDCARDLPPPDALAVADDAVRTGQVDQEELVAAAARLRGPGSGNAKRVVGWVDRRSSSALESVVRGTLLAAGVTGFEPQFPIRISTGHLLHADLGHREARLLVEAESKLAHTGADKLEVDSLRYTEFAAAGYVVVRFTWFAAMRRRPWLVQMINRAIEHRI